MRSRGHQSTRRASGRETVQVRELERQQRTVVERGGEGGTAGVEDLGVAEVEQVEHRKLRWRRRHEGGEALVAQRVVRETESLQRGAAALVPYCRVVPRRPSAEERSHIKSAT